MMWRSFWDSAVMTVPQIHARLREIVFMRHRLLGADADDGLEVPARSTAHDIFVGSGWFFITDTSITRHVGQ